MIVTFGSERECAFFRSRAMTKTEELKAKASRTEKLEPGYLSEQVVNLISRSHDFEDDRNAGFRCYYDVGHAEIVTPVSDDLFSAVAAYHHIDGMQSKACRVYSDNLAARKGNHCYHHEESFATHDNYVFYDLSVSSINNVICGDAFKLAMWCRTILAGEGGFFGSLFTYSPRACKHKNRVMWKGRRLQITCSMDNSSPVCTAIRLAMPLAVIGLGARGVLPPHPGGKENGQLTCDLSDTGTGLHKESLRRLQYAIELAEACELNMDMFPDGMAEAVAAWRSGAEQLLRGELPMWIDWAAKKAFIDRMDDDKRENTKLMHVFDTNWHRLDQQSVGGELRKRLAGLDVCKHWQGKYVVPDRGLSAVMRAGHFYIDECEEERIVAFADSGRIVIERPGNSGITSRCEFIMEGDRYAVIPVNDDMPLEYGILIDSGEKTIRLKMASTNRIRRVPKNQIIYCGRA